MPKPRSDAKLKSLPPNQRDMLIRWLVDENVSYEKARERLREDFGVETSTGALSAFYSNECFTVRYGQARDLAETIGQAMTSEPEKFDEATIAMVKQKAFERAVAKDGDIKELAILAGILTDTAKLRIKEKEVDLASRRVGLLEEKAAQAKAQLESALAGVKTRGGLTPETLKQIEEAAALL